MMVTTLAIVYYVICAVIAMFLGKTFGETWREYWILNGICIVVFALCYARLCWCLHLVAGAGDFMTTMYMVACALGAFVTQIAFASIGVILGGRR